MSHVQLPNQHLAGMSDDFMFHLGFAIDDEIRKTFSNVKFVCIGGTPSRVRGLAHHIAKAVYNQNVDDDSQLDYVFQNDRYSGYKVNNVWCVSHGMGLPSVSIVLHEIFKVLHYARCSDVTLLRLGTCGGIGTEEGTLVVSNGVLTAGLKPVYTTSRLGQPLELATEPDLDVVRDVLNCQSKFPVIEAKTYCAEDFYIGQGRLDGAICDYGEADKQEFLQTLYDLGVRNIEMESAAVLALSKKAGIKAAVLCVTLVNRNERDIPVTSPDVMKEWDDRLLSVVSDFISLRRGQSGHLQTI